MRKTTEKAIVISAPMGLSQNDSCSKPTWRTTRPASLTPRKLPRSGTDTVTPGSETALIRPTS